MTPLFLEQGLHELVDRLEEGHVPYMVIGGLAATTWGVARMTQDVDVTVMVPLEDLDDFAGRVLKGFPHRIAEAVAFARESRVLLVSAPNGTPIDIILGLLPLEASAIQRARKVKIAGRDVQVATPEDVILLKVVNPRPQDEQDIREIIAEQAAEIDRGYLDIRISELADLMEDPSIEKLYGDAWRAIQ